MELCCGFFWTSIGHEVPFSGVHNLHVSADVTEAVTLRDRDRGVTVPRYKGFSPEIKTSCCRVHVEERPKRVFITAGPITKLCAWGEEDSGGHVL
jgi:hypothetical protein